MHLSVKSHLAISIALFVLVLATAFIVFVSDNDSDSVSLDDYYSMCTVSFVSEEISDLNISDIEVFPNNSVEIMMVVPNREDYTFAGWSNESGSITLLVEDAGDDNCCSLVVESDIVLHTIWEKKPYYCSFNANGGVGQITTKIVYFGDNIVLSDGVGFQRENYVMIGWKLNNRENGSYELIPLSKEFIWNHHCDVIYYAVWQGHFEVSYNNNGGGGAIDSVFMSRGQTVLLNDGSSLEKTGYEFVFWNTKSDATGDCYLPGGYYTLSYEKNETLYAIWDPIEQTIFFDTNGGSGIISSISVDNGTTIHLPAISSSKDGFIIDGWNTRSDGSGLSYAQGSEYTVTSSLTFYVKWIDESAEVTPDITSPSTPSTPQSPSSSEPSSTVTYVVDYVSSPSEGGSVIGVGTYNSGDNVTVTALPNEGYGFVGWGDSIDNPYTFTITDDVTLRPTFILGLHLNKISAFISTSKGDVDIGIRPLEMIGEGDSIIHNSIMRPDVVAGKNIILRIQNSDGSEMYRWNIDCKSEYNESSKDSILDISVIVSLNGEEMFPDNHEIILKKLNDGRNTEMILFIDPELEGTTPYHTVLTKSIVGFEGREFNIFVYDESIGDFIDSGMTCSVSGGEVSFDINSGSTYALVMEIQTIPQGFTAIPAIIVAIIVFTSVFAVAIYRKGIR